MEVKKCGRLKSYKEIRKNSPEILKWILLSFCLLFILVSFNCCKDAEKNKEIIGVVVNIDKNDSNSAEPNKFSIALETFPSKTKIKDKVLESYETTVSGKYYRGYILKGGKIETPESNYEIYKVLARIDYNSETKVDIYIESKVLCEIKFIGFGVNTLKDLDSNKEFQKPYKLKPGKYHLIYGK